MGFSAGEQVDVYDYYGVRPEKVMLVLVPETYLLRFGAQGLGLKV